MHNVVATAVNKGLDVSHIEGLIPKEYGSDAVTTPGARDLLGSLQKAGAPWAIVTSGTKALLTGVRDTFYLLTLSCIQGNLMILDMAKRD